MNTEQINRLKGIAVSLVRDHKIVTPFLLMDEERLQEALELFETYLPQVRLFYAAKANSSVNLIRYFANKGLSIDVASAGEINTAAALQISGDKLFLSTPIKTIETIEAMFKHRVAAFAIDTISEIEKIASYQKAYHHTHLPKVFIRIRIESKNIEVDLNTKFGCSTSEAINILERTKELGFEIGGICFHVGTQSTNPDNYFFGIETSKLIAKEAWRRFRIKVPVINIGGGFCDPVVASKASLDLRAFYKSIGEACQEAISAGFDVYAEPGRCLANPAGALVTSVIGTNIRNDQRWAYLDDGIYGCYSIKSYENHEFQFYPINSIRQARNLRISNNKKTWTVAGPTCDSLDIIAEDVELPESLNSGDLILTPNLGAYSVSTSCSFNGFSLPECHVVRTVMKNNKMSTIILNSDTHSQDKIVANF